MKIPQTIIQQQSERVSQAFMQWEPYMETQVEFWTIPGDLDIHTQGHCERVLMHALRIGDARQVTDRQLQALAMASIFHDTRRKDNYLDTGHGARAAAYYKAFCADHELPFLPETYEAICFHDRDDAMGEEDIREHAGADAAPWIEVYHIFKDADALDRLRLGTWCLDPKYLRTPEAKTMIAFAQHLVEVTIPVDELRHTYEQTEPFRPKE